MHNGVGVLCSYDESERSNEGNPDTRASYFTLLTQPNRE